MKKAIFTLVFTVFFFSLNAQLWIDKNYVYDSVLNITYGTATDFSGDIDTLKMDIYSPVCPQSQTNARSPLVVIIHGGAFLDGDKSEASIKTLCREFAQRGYVAASINYRLGFIADDHAWSCNYPNYSCVFAVDSAEWYRAYFRAVQDGKGALRYLINRHDLFHIDTGNVFIVGESAGAMLSLGLALMDTAIEKPQEAFAISDVSIPNSNTLSCPYNQGKTFTGSSISRPDLGSYEGNIEPSTIQFTIKGIGNMFGAMMGDLLKYHKGNTPKPAIFSYHQPCDLVVPIDSGAIFQGLSWCMTNGYNCYGIAHTPKIYGSRAISNWNNSGNYGYTIHDEFTNTEFPYNFLFGPGSCADQVNNPCHAYDNQNLRMNNLISFFAPLVSSSGICDTTTSIGNEKGIMEMELYPNPATGILQVNLNISGTYELTIYSVFGEKVFKEKIATMKNSSVYKLDLQNLNPGIYFLNIKSTEGNKVTRKFLKL